MNNKNINFIALKSIIIPISVTFFLISISFIFLKGINFNIDFTGGFSFEIKFINFSPNIEKIRGKIKNLGISNFRVQEFNKKNFLIEINEPNFKDKKQLLNKIKEVLKFNDQNVEIQKVEIIGPKIGKELIKNSIKAIIISFLSIIVYILFRFGWKFSIYACIVIAYNIVGILGFFSIFSIKFIDSSVISILLTIGYSINDMIVIFDRIRENLSKYIKCKELSFENLLNKSINQVLKRTIFISTTTILSLIPLYILGGDLISNFSLPILIGLIFGSLISIFLIAPIIDFFEKINFIRCIKKYTKFS